MHFTVAHEIGHIVLHAENSLIKNRRHNLMLKINDEFGDRKLERIEREADTFASYLLMPTSRLFHENQKKTIHIFKLLDILRLRNYRNKRTKAIRFADKIKRRWF